MGPGWGQAGDTNVEPIGFLGALDIASLQSAGYNVLTWDPARLRASRAAPSRSTAPTTRARTCSGCSTGSRPAGGVQLDGAGDPRVGMVGGSYGGGIQLVTAAIDCRVDAIVPIDRLALAADEPLQGRHRQERLGRPALRRRRRPHGRPAHHPRPRVGHRDRHARRRRPGVVRRPRSRRPRRATSPSRRSSCRAPSTRCSPSTRASRTTGSCATAACRRDAVVLRRPRRVPHRTRATPTASAPPPSPGCSRYVKDDASVDTGARFDFIDQDGAALHRRRLAAAPAGTPITATGRARSTLTDRRRAGPGHVPAGKAGCSTSIVGPITPAKATNAVNVTDRRAAATP